MRVKTVYKNVILLKTFVLLFCLRVRKVLSEAEENLNVNIQIGLPR